MSNYIKALDVGGDRFLTLLAASQQLHAFAWMAFIERPFDYSKWRMLYQEYTSLRENAWREFHRSTGGCTK